MHMRSQLLKERSPSSEEMDAVNRKIAKEIGDRSFDRIGAGA